MSDRFEITNEELNDYYFVVLIAIQFVAMYFFGKIDRKIKDMFRDRLNRDNGDDQSGMTTV